MQKTTSATPLDAVKVEQRPDGQADIWLRKNIQQEEVTPEDGGEPYTQYTADEAHIVKAMTQEEAEAAFDELWDEAVAAETPQDERIATLEAMAASLTDEQAISVSGLIPAYEVGRDYKKGDLLTYEGEVYRVAQDHTSQAQWVPGSGTESLYTHITLAGDSIPVWQQPTGAHDAYNTGDKVHYPDESGPVYVSKIDGNTWSPDAYPAGWELSE